MIQWSSNHEHDLRIINFLMFQESGNERVSENTFCFETLCLLANNLALECHWLQPIFPEFQKRSSKFRRDFLLSICSKDLFEFPISGKGSDTWWDCRGDCNCTCICICTCDRIYTCNSNFRFSYIFKFPISDNSLAPGKVARVIMGWGLLNVFSHHVFPLPGQCGHLYLFVFVFVFAFQFHLYLLLLVSARSNQTLTTNLHLTCYAQFISISPDCHTYPYPDFILLQSQSWFPTLAFQLGGGIHLPS